MKERIVASLSKRIALLAMLGIISVAQGQPVKLPSYQVDLKQTSVSGLSSGAFMATQFQVAYSSIMVGAGIIAGGPFYCAGTYPLRSYVGAAMTTCMNPGVLWPEPDAAVSLSSAKVFERMGEIDNLANLKKQKIYVFSGVNDNTVTTPVVNQTASFYQLAGVPAQNIKYVTNINAGHAITTNNDNNQPCPVTASPYINDCDITQSQEILTHIYGPLNPPAMTLSGTIIAFDQDEFSPSMLSSMNDTAYAYVPKSCDTETCKVHVAFHGCEQGTSKIGNLFYTTTGYNETADTNNIIVLYPQVEVSGPIPFNPKGCWDFWGYSSPFQAFGLVNFYSKQAPQMAAVKAMLDRLSKRRK
ncbi:MAG: poly(3-hydroxybutyrate) depolymerase [Janthinobacterium sp.]|jgi:poly(3-hydroxybutyrate) depolymerase